MKYKYFFSYKSDDVELVRKVCEQLYAENIPIWLDEYRIKHNKREQFQEYVYEGVDQSEYGVLFITSKYADSTYCWLEVERLLRRLPIENIIPIELEYSERFNRLYPEFSTRLIKVERDAHAILDILKTKSNLTTKHQTFFKPTKSESVWSIIEAGFRFNPHNLKVKLDSIFTHTKRLDINPGTKKRKEGYELFVANEIGIELLFDCDFYRSKHSETVKARLDIPESNQVKTIDQKNREQLIDQKDRERLIEEMEVYGEEIEAVMKRLSMSYDLEYIDKVMIKELGIHMLFTTDRGEEYIHRMYTFRIERLNRTFRMIKLVLNHPIHESVYLIRFIFSCKGPVEKFFYYAPLYRQILDSFTWPKSAEVLSKDEFTKARDLFN